MESLKSTLGILMWFVVSIVIAYHIGIMDQNPLLGTRNFSLCSLRSDPGEEIKYLILYYSRLEITAPSPRIYTLGQSHAKPGVDTNAVEQYVYY